MTKDVIQFPPRSSPESARHLSGLVAIEEGQIVQLNDIRPPVWYDIAVCHHPNGSVETWTIGVDDSAHSRACVAAALRQAAHSLETCKADQSDG